MQCLTPVRTLAVFGSQVLFIHPPPPLLYGSLQRSERCQEKARFETERSASQQQQAESQDAERAATKGMFKQRYEERAQMYEAARNSTLDFRGERHASVLFGRDPFCGVNNFEGAAARGPIKLYMPGLYGLTNVTLNLINHV